MFFFATSSVIRLAGDGGCHLPLKGKALFLLCIRLHPDALKAVGAVEDGEGHVQQGQQRDAAGALAQGEPMADVAARFIDFVLAAASGAPVNNEKNGWREIAIFKSGVTL